ncbi:dihydrofolate reductase [Aquabacterium fontiphilum]|jgi:dihydrofolate reductase|uniref:dihydrofolate reductase n=1 Tax=Aquabacterium fontiphilum TaxID=450365 RepID=UPI001378D987|nr:dihydrofolate reductase [Aquabacterium fontiphilum]NBD20930.1 dihydrofolate reductase [Aquabacterium fontiphilum]
MPSKKPDTLSLIAAVAANGAIGRNNDLLWHDSRDQKHFRATTMGCPVIMGRRTWDSLPERFRPLPGRRNVVVTRNSSWQAQGAEVAHSLDAALALVADAPKVFVMGGGELYALALPMADELELTEVDATFEADTFFPAWPREAFATIHREAHPPGPAGEPGFAFVTYRRRTTP